jgi:Zn-dependent protease with chaperone function
MALKRKDFDSLIERLKLYAQEKPKEYKMWVVLLGLLGYAYVFLVLAVLTGLIAGTVWLLGHTDGGRAGLGKILIFLIIIAFIILKSLWVKIVAPTGTAVTAQQAPALFGIIDEICIKQHAPRPHAVLLNNDFNAFISQVPRLGILGWYKNYLVLGVPYMLSCNTAQFKAVLAHEFGHFSGSHGRLGTWIYRMRVSWYNIMENMQRESAFGNFVFKWFFELYVPYFNAYSFVLAREQEYEADRFANDYAGAEANAEELVNSVIKNFATGPYWSAVWARVNDEANPPAQVFSRSVDVLNRQVPQQEYDAYLKKAMKIRTQNADTHPALADRLAALGYAPREGRILDSAGKPLELQRPVQVSAADELLGRGQVERLLKQFDEDWAKAIDKDWKARHEEVRKMKKSIEELDRKAQTAALSHNEMTDRAYFIDQTGTRGQAIQAIRELLAAHPAHAQANYRLGELLLEADDAGGVDYLKKAMKLDASFSSGCLDKIRWFHEGRGEYEAVESTMEKLDASSEKDEKDYIERNSLSAKDRFKEHGLEARLVEDLAGQLAAFAGEIKAAYLVQKAMTVYPQIPLYVLAVKGSPKGFHMDIQGFNVKLVNRLAESVRLNGPNNALLFSVGDEALIKKVKKIPEALVKIKR